MRLLSLRTCEGPGCLVPLLFLPLALQGAGGPESRLGVGQGKGARLPEGSCRGSSRGRDGFTSPWCCVGCIVSSVAGSGSGAVLVGLGQGVTVRCLQTQFQVLKSTSGGHLIPADVVFKTQTKAKTTGSLKGYLSVA